MKHRIVFLLALLGLVSCSGQKTALKDSDRTDLIQVIESHDNTFKSMLETNIKPYLEELERNNVGIVIIHYGKEEAVVDLKSKNRLVINLDLSIPFLIKRDANKTMLSLLKDYRKTKAMPIPLLVNKDGFVENYDEEDGHYGYTKIYSLLTIHK